MAENSDGEHVAYRGDGGVRSVGGREVESHGSGTASWDPQGNKYSDRGPSYDDNGEREK